MTHPTLALVTGGAGYIGAHMVLALLDAGWDVVVVDDFSTGRREAVPEAATLIECDIGDRARIDAALARHRPAAVLHFAGSVVVPESVRDPLKYYDNNTGKSRGLIAACVAAGTPSFIFSSTAAVYGNPERIPVTEDTPTAPINPYGTSKLCTEFMLRDTAAATGLRYVALRYFNVAGADPAGRTGQATPDATHLIKVACEAAVGRRDGITVFGDDYPTPDGTCIRDYIHVSDLVDAHLRALEYLAGGGESGVFNCGYGHGFSVREVIEAVQRASDGSLRVQTGPRRAGDSARLVSDPGRLKARLGWRPRHDDLGVIVETALAWERRMAAEARAHAR
jgi:UDP-glucose 4-epimerase